MARPLDVVEDGEVSLIALTSHFAQVQFRLKQITAASPDQREALLEELEKFAFQGCPVQLTYDTLTEGEQRSTERQHQCLTNLLDHLQSQIQHASSQGQEATPTSPTPEQRESIILDELKKKFNSQFTDLEGLSEEEVRSKVDHFLSSKESGRDQMVRQLAGQVRAMEDHINQLQHELATVSVTSPHTNSSDMDFNYEVTWCQQAAHDDLMALHQASSEESVVNPVLVRSSRAKNKRDPHHPQREVRALQRTLAVMQILTLWQCGGLFNCLPKSSSDIMSKSSAQFPSAMRALEFAVDKISIVVTALSQPGQDVGASAQLESNLHDEVSMNLSDALRELLENGWEGPSPGLPTSCLPPLNLVAKSKLEGDSRDCLAWRTLIYYYNLKKGSKVCDKPQNRLSSSFGLPFDTTTPAKKTFLSVIHRTEKAFVGCRNYSSDLKFRALVCQGFNLHHLSDWIKLLVHHPTLVGDLYRSSSFITSTKLRPVVQCLDRLTCLPAAPPVELPPSFYHHTNSYFSQ